MNLDIIYNIIFISFRNCMYEFEPFVRLLKCEVKKRKLPENFFFKTNSSNCFANEKSFALGFGYALRNKNLIRNWINQRI